MNTKLLAFVAAAAIASTGTAAWRFADSAASAPTARATAEDRTTTSPDKPKGLVAVSADQIEAQEIGTVRLGRGVLARHLAVPGTIVTNADRVARVPARVVGTVSEMRRRLGDDVKVGDVVAVLDSREVADAKSEFLTASVNLELQKTLHERAKGLWEKRVAPENQYLQVRNTFAEATLRTDLARQKLSALGIDAAVVASAVKASPQAASLRQYELKSPIGGRVVERKVDVGTAVGKEGEPADVYTIADLTVLWIDIAVPTAELASVNEGASVAIRVGGDEPRAGEAKVVFVSPLLNQDTRTARVIAALPNPRLSWRPGTFVDAEIALPARAARLLVPRGAVQKIDGEPKVFVKTPQGFEAREVRLGPSDDRSFEVLSGVADGDIVAAVNSFLLKAELCKSEAESD